MDRELAMKANNQRIPFRIILLLLLAFIFTTTSVSIAGEITAESVKIRLQQDSVKAREELFSDLKEQRRSVGEALIEILKDRSDGFKTASRSGVAARSLGVMRYSPAVPALVESLDEIGDLDELYINPAREALEQIGLPAVPYLLDAIRDSNSHARQENAIFVLKQICGEEWAQILIKRGQ